MPWNSLPDLFPLLFCSGRGAVSGSQCRPSRAASPRRRGREWPWPVLLTLFLVLAPDSAGQTLFDREGRRLEVDISERFDKDRRGEMLGWVEHIADALELVYGHWPETVWRVSVQPASGASDDVIPWAQVQRGEVDEVEFFVLPGADAKRLNSAWTGYHELSHLLIPYRGWGDVWFSEGLASYYQNLLQGRTGVLEEKAMWQKLHEGFMRGRNDFRFDGQTLSEVSRNMRSNGGYMRVYWSGAWYFLAADVALRQRGGEPGSLDRALKRLNQCCAGEALSVSEMVALLDELNGVDLFSTLYDKARVSTAVPDFAYLYDALGITVEAGEVQLSRGDEEAGLRRQILHFSEL